MGVKSKCLIDAFFSPISAGMLTMNLDRQNKVAENVDEEQVEHGITVAK